MKIGDDVARAKYARESAKHVPVSFGKLVERDRRISVRYRTADNRSNF